MNDNVAHQLINILYPNNVHGRVRVRAVYMDRVHGRVHDHVHGGVQSGSLGHPCKFQWVLHLGSVTARRSTSERQPNFTALNRGRHLYSEGRPSR